MLLGTPCGAEHLKLWSAKLTKLKVTFHCPKSGGAIIPLTGPGVELCGNRRIYYLRPGPQSVGCAIPAVTIPRAAYL